MGDLEDLNAVKKLIRGTSSLIHLACNNYPRSNSSDNRIEIEKDLISTLNLFETFAKLNPHGHIIFTSTGGNMYDDTRNGILRTEEDEPKPRSVYAAQKLIAENHLRAVCQQYGIKGTVFRITNPYGVLLSKDSPKGLIGVALMKIFTNEPLIIFDSLDSVRDYIHLKDVLKAFNLSLQNPPKKGECQMFHVSSGTGHSIAEVLQTIEMTTNKSFVTQISNELSVPSFSVLSSKKITKTLGWAPSINFHEGIQQMADELKITHNPRKGSTK